MGHSVDIFRTMPSEQTGIHPVIQKYALLKRTRSIPRPAGRFKRIIQGLRMLSGGMLRNPILILRALNVFKYGRKAASLRHLYLASCFTGSYDAVHCHYGMLGDIGVLLKELGARTGPILTSFHGFDITTHLQDNGNDCYKNLFEKGDRFLPISENWRRKLIELGCPPERIVVHRMAVDLKQFQYIPRSLASGETAAVLSVARFVEKKGLEYAITAVAALLKRGVDLQYTIIGDGELRSSLTALIEELGAGDRIRMDGWQQQDEVLKAMNRSHILLTPSVTASSGDQEGIPVVLMEAMAMGLPVLSTIHSGIPELVQNGISGILVPPRDSKAIEDALYSLISNPGSWSGIEKAARERVETDYNIKSQIRRLEHIYSEASKDIL